MYQIDFKNRISQSEFFCEERTCERSYRGKRGGGKGRSAFTERPSRALVFRFQNNYRLRWENDDTSVTKIMYVVVFGSICQIPK